MRSLSFKIANYLFWIKTGELIKHFFMPYSTKIILIKNWSFIIITPSITSFPIKVLSKSIGLTFFIDGGILTNKMGYISHPNMKWDAGLGVTIKTPLGPFRVDYAFRIICIEGPGIGFWPKYMKEI